MKKIKLLILICVSILTLSFIISGEPKISIIGDWGIFNTINIENDRSVSSRCNVCPRINFKPDNTADLTNGKGEVFKIRWKQNSDTLIIQSETQATQSIIEDNKYLIKITNTTNDFLEMELVVLNKSVKIILRKGL